MFKKLLGKALEELPPLNRIIIIILISGLMALGGAIRILWNNINNRSVNDFNNKDIQIKYLQDQVSKKDSIIVVKSNMIDLKINKIDSLTNKAYLDKSETNKQLQLIIDKQNNQKQLLRKLK